MLNLFSLFMALIPTEESPGETHAIGGKTLDDIPLVSNDSDWQNEAIVTQTIKPGSKGQVKFQGSWWTARCELGITLVPGKVVYVIARQNSTTLYVLPHAPFPARR
ncbi:MAG: NfeD family protein [Kovacikia sp.]